MDVAGLAVLLKELEADAAVVRDAAAKAAQRVEQQYPGHLEAAAYELGRLYSAFERSLERISDDFENQFERRGDYHAKLLQRLSLDLPGIRPAFIPPERLPALRELKGFRHLTRHAYDVVLREDRLRDLARLGVQLADDLPGWSAEFATRVRREQGW
ncbi:MAG TPA: hypothetical protein VK993_12425 [Chthoniobacterales bacterium]|nr:hypothetical protein [Chthoniobacterales bacterium]